MGSMLQPLNENDTQKRCSDLFSSKLCTQCPQQKFSAEKLEDYTACSGEVSSPKRDCKTINRRLRSSLNRAA